ncbi:MAG: NfeD family protein [Fusobacteria bacterium]|nr:NfeD family protein [Fusobacteriota bacterium]
MAYYFIGVGILLVLFEMLTPTLFIFLSFGLATIIAGVVAFFFPHLPTLLTIVIILTLIFYFSMKKIPLSLKPNAYKGNISEYIGRRVTIVDTKENCEYRVKVYDDIWNATTHENEDVFLLNEFAYIYKIESSTLYIQKNPLK